MLILKLLQVMLGATCVILMAGVSLSAHALNILVTNDDGCEASTVHALYQKLTASGHQVIIAASMFDQSGQGGALAFLRPVTTLTSASRGGNLPVGTPGIASLTGIAGISYGDHVFCINSSPVGSTLYGLDIAAAAVFGAPVDLVISGPNYGNNTGLINNGSGTVNAALIAINRGVPAIAVSAAEPQAYRPFNALQSSDQEYENASLVVALVDTLVRRSQHGKQKLIDAGLGLNVNFPKYPVGNSGTLRWKMADEGMAAVAVPFFVADLSTSAFAQANGLGGTHLPGVSLKMAGVSDAAISGLNFVNDDRPSSEQNVINAGHIAVSVIQGNHQAQTAAKTHMRLQLGDLLK